MAFLPYKSVTKNAGKILIFALGVCVLLAFAGWAHLGIAQQSLGATRWFNLGPLGSLQPSEFLKFAILVFIAGFLGNKVTGLAKVNNVHETLIPLAIITAISMLFIIVIQKDLGTGISLVCIIASMLYIGGIDKRIGGIIYLLLLPLD
jgi:cell division protein FtsW (lipid II flippase)